MTHVMNTGPIKAACMVSRTESGVSTRCNLMLHFRASETDVLRITGGNAEREGRGELGSLQILSSLPRNFLEKKHLVGSRARRLKWKIT